MNVTNWQKIDKGALLGSCDVEMPSGLSIHGVLVLRATDGRLWCSPPGIPMLDRDDRAMVDDKGKRRFKKTISFRDRGVSDRWSDAIIAELSALGHV